MNIHLNRSRQRGLVLLMILIIIVLIVVGTIIVGLYKMSKKIPASTKPDEAQWQQWDSEAKAQAKAAHPEADEWIPYRRFLLPPGFGVVVRSDSPSAVPEDIMQMLIAEGMRTMPRLPPQYGLTLYETDGSEWQLMETNGVAIHYRIVTQEEVLGFTMPPPDPTVPMMFYRTIMVETNNYENPIP